MGTRGGSGQVTLFTIKFSSSSDESEKPPPPSPPPAAKKRHSPVPKSEPVKVVTEVMHIDPASDGSHPPRPHSRQDQSDDVFTLPDDDEPAPPAPPPPSFPARPSPPQFRGVTVPKRIESISKTYVVSRDAKKHLNGKSVFFKLEEEMMPLFVAKFKKRTVAIFTADRGAHLSGTADAVLLVANESQDFSLRKPATENVLTVRIMSPTLPVENARKVTVNFFVERPGPPAQLVSKNPKLNPDGKVAHDFGGKFAIDSVKNAVLVAKQDGPPLLFIRKAGKDALEIDAWFLYEPLWIFAMGIASFMTKVK
jgi:hypothetical protein